MKGSSRSRAAVGVAATAVFALVAASCGSDEDNSSATNAASTSAAGTTAGTTAGSTAGTTAGSSAGAASDAPVKVMYIGNLEAPNFQTPEALEGAKLRIDAFNAQGGRQIELSTCNDKFDSNEGGACARKAVDQGVAAVISGFTSSDDQITPILEDAGIPFIGYPTNDVSFASPIVYSLVSARMTYIDDGKYMVDQGCDKAGIIEVDTPASVESADTMGKAVTAAGGQVVSNQAVPGGAPDFAPSVEAAISKGAECLGYILYPTDMSKLLAAVQQSSKPDLMLVGALGNTQQIIGDLKSAADGLIGTSFFAPPGDPARKEFDDEKTAANADFLVDEFSLAGWTAAKVLTEVLSGMSGDVDAAAMKTALDGASNVDTGIAGVVDFTTPLDAKGFERIFITTNYVYKAKDGAYSGTGDKIDGREIAGQALS